MTMERILASIEMQRPAVAKPGDGATPCPRCGANAVAHRFRARDGAMVETLHCGRCGDVCGSRDPVGARCADCRQGRSATPGDRVAWHRCGRGLPGWWGSAVHRCGQFDPMAENRPETALAGDEDATRHPTIAGPAKSLAGDSRPVSRDSGGRHERV